MATPVYLRRLQLMAEHAMTGKGLRALAVEKISAAYTQALEKNIALDEPWRRSMHIEALLRTATGAALKYQTPQEWAAVLRALADELERPA